MTGEGPRGRQVVDEGEEDAVTDARLEDALVDDTDPLPFPRATPGSACDFGNLPAWSRAER
jgi:hypothetical protein